MARSPEEDLIIKLYNIKVAMEGLAAEQRAKMDSDGREERVNYWLNKAKEVENIYIDIKKKLRGQNGQREESL
jgi:predicted P-loop ATPase